MALSEKTSGRINQPSAKGWFILIGCVLILISVTAFTRTLHSALYPAVEEELIIVPSDVNISDSPTTAPTKSKSVSAKPVPVFVGKLIIPSLKIKSDIEKTGITTKGIMGSPTTFQTVAWYKYGPEPGEPGLAIIDGHVNNGLGINGVFEHLDELEIGEKVQVVDTKGQTVTFIVKNKSVIGYSDHLNDLYTGLDQNKSSLALITCDGAWLSDEKTYDKRIVVLAERE